MNDFVLKDVNSNIKNELDNIGFDKSYIDVAIDKYQYKNIKIFDLTLPQANILKQTAISVGADCAVNRGVITSQVEKTDCILGGSFAQLRKIAQKLKGQPFKLALLAENILNNIDVKLTPLNLKGNLFDFSKPYVVGILNLTKNSFSDGGDYYEFEAATNHLMDMINEGADIIDIGAESTKPFSEAVSAENQLEMLLPVLNFIKENNIKIPVSIDTRSSVVAEKCVFAGADIINDVSGLTYDCNMTKVVADLKVPVIIQHSQGIPENMQCNPEYLNLIDEIYMDLKLKTDLAIKNGICASNIIIDAGIGFGKTKEQNLEIINRIDEFSSLGFAIMIGLSRKSFLDMPDESNDVKDLYTLAFNSRLLNKINFFRVHNVKIHKKLLSLRKN